MNLGALVSFQACSAFDLMVTTMQDQLAHATSLKRRHVTHGQKKEV
jgi:hypothetical protein